MKLIQKIEASKYYTITSYVQTHDQAMKSIEEGKADVIVEIPINFEKNLIRQGTQTINISANSINGIKGTMGNSYLIGIINDFTSSLKTYQTKIMTEGQTAQTFTIKPYYLFNPRLDYKIFMVPAIMVMLLTLISGFLPALNIVGEKEKGTLEQINVTPVTRHMFIFSKLIPYWIIGLVLFFYAMLCSKIIYGLVPVGSIFTLLIFAVVYIAVISGFGLIISNYAGTMQQALLLIFFFMLIFILTSGLFTPISSMPQWMQYITTINPLKYFIEVMRMVYLKGSTLLTLIPYLFSLLGFAVVLDSWAIVSYKKSAK
jgi:ABC-2 type transport system permease protein